ncbi:sodium-translocating pyrophosphatase [Pontiella sp.]|uniref:sodium-translocating pyrophosphatase n=1 Tax=Pontiella sp. TaxID=2837462 RepID=UPI00356A1D20
MDTLSWTLLFVAGGSLLALGYAALKTKWIFRQRVENPKLAQIGGFVSDGAMAFLTREYKVLIPFVVIVAAFLAIANQGALKFQAVAFVVGATASALAGFIGMKVATAANSRTTQAAQGGLIPALKVAFSGGSVMGMSVVGLSMLGFCILLFLGRLRFGSSFESLSGTILPVITGFSLGASSMALFARVGGGIFTKAADVGADLVGKVEAGIPEDDHRNPATIADNVGDNVGDVAGMGADLFESYVGSIIGAMVLGASVAGSEAYRTTLVMFPLILAVAGILAAMIGVLFVRVKEGQSPQAALNKGTFGAAGIAAVFSFLLCRFLLGGNEGWLAIFFSSVLGMVAGTLIGMITEHYTGTGTRPVIKIVKACETGPATTLISGMGVGMVSAFPPIIIIVAAILSSEALSGLYGIAIAALGMLMTLGIQLAVDAYGPIADNAGGLAEMSEFPPEVREITDELDAVGNTTAAIGKGFAIGSAALTAIILFSAFQKQVGVGVINLVDPKVVSGVLLGAVLPYLFSSMAMNAVGEAAFDMIKEVRRQFRENPGILKETAQPDYKKCVDISTASALKGMIIPGVVAVLTPVLVGFIGGPAMLAGTLIGVTASGVVLAIFMSNAGGAWDNAKKMIEGGASQGKGSEAHKAAVVGDTVGDPFKDTAGPSLNILIKLMAVISLVIAPMLKNFWGL